MNNRPKGQWLRRPQRWLGAAALLLCTCDAPKSGPESPGKARAVLTDRAKVLDDEGLRALARVSRTGDRYEVDFSALSPTLETLAQGDVLIVGESRATPHGALLAIEGVAPAEAGLRVEARLAALDEAFEELELDLETVLTQASKVEMALPKGRAVSGSQQALGVTFPFSVEGESDQGRVQLSGSLAVDSDIALRLKLALDPVSLKELSLTFEAKETFVAELLGEGQTTFDETVELGSIAFATITIFVPIPAPPYAVPVILTPRVTLEVGLQGRVQGAVEANVVQQAAFTAGLGFRNGKFGGFSDDDSEFQVEQPTYQAAANVRAWGGPRLSVLVYDTVGPFAGVEAFVELGANGEGPPPCVTGALDAGLRAKVGVDFIAKYQTTLFDKRYPVAQFNSCTNDPNAPRPAVTWARSFGRVDSPGEQAKAVVEASDGTYFVVGESERFEQVSAFAASMWALRLDPLGNVIWQRAFGRLPEQGLTRAAAEVPDGFVVAGTSGLIKLDSGGNVVWAQTYEHAAPLEIHALAAHADGSLALAGHRGTDTQAWVMKVDPDGEVVWSHGFGAETFTSIRVTADGGYVAMGNSAANLGDIAVVKLDAEGEVTWARALDNRFDSKSAEDAPTRLASSGDRGFDVVERPAGGYVIAGESYGNFPLPAPDLSPFYATWIAELDAQGGLTAGGNTVHRTPSTALYGGAYALGIRPNGTTLAIGRRADQATDLLNHEDLLVVQGGAYNVLGGPGNDFVYSSTLAGASRGMPLQMTRDGGAIIAATSNSFSGLDQFWLVKLNRAGNINAPFRTSISGSSYVNEHATSAALATEATPLSVRSRAFTAEVRTEEADWVTAQQAP